MKQKIFFLLLLNFSFSPAFADFGWLPKPRRLVLKGGYAGASSGSNFDLTSIAIALPQSGFFSQSKFFLDGEYGIVDDLAVGLEVPFVSNSISGLSPATGTGFSDINARLKWSLKREGPLITLESKIKAPTGSYTVADNSELVTGDGNLDISVWGHFGLRSGKFLVSLSPGLLFRSGGYSSAWVLDLMGQYGWGKGYVRAVFHTIYSFTDSFLNDSSLTNHDAPGTGGSLMLLNGTPAGFETEGRVGLRLTQAVSFEVFVAKAFFGTHYPNVFRGGGNLVVRIDFETPPEKPKAREVPWDYEYGSD